VSRVMGSLTSSADAVVAVDGMDNFALGFEPGWFEEVANIIKFQGMFRDRELYNYEVGPWYPGANWSRPLRPRAQQYSARELDGLRLSVSYMMIDLPGLLRNARRYESRGAQTIGRELSLTDRVARDLGEGVLSKLIAIAPVGNRPLDVHCLVSLSNV